MLGIFSGLSFDRVFLALLKFSTIRPQICWVPEEEPDLLTACCVTLMKTLNLSWSGFTIFLMEASTQCAMR